MVTYEQPEGIIPAEITLAVCLVYVGVLVERSLFEFPIFYFLSACYNFIEIHLLDIQRQNFQILSDEGGLLFYNSFGSWLFPSSSMTVT